MLPFLGPHPAGPPFFLMAWLAFLFVPWSVWPHLSGFAFSLRCLSGHFFLCSLEQANT